MAITTYAELQAAIGNWLDHGLFAARTPEFIALFEAAANRRLRVREQETSTTLVPSAGAVALPADYLMWRRLTWTGSTRVELQYVHPSYLQAAYPSAPRCRRSGRRSGRRRPPRARPPGPVSGARQRAARS